jgi:hypothetical protein
MIYRYTHGSIRRASSWLDDEISAADRNGAEAHHPASALLLQVAAGARLTDKDFVRIPRWLTTL